MAEASLREILCETSAAAPVLRLWLLLRREGGRPRTLQEAGGGATADGLRLLWPRFVTEPTHGRFRRALCASPEARDAGGARLRVGEVSVCGGAPGGWSERPKMAALHGIHAGHDSDSHRGVELDLKGLRFSRFSGSPAS